MKCDMDIMECVCESRVESVCVCVCEGDVFKQYWHNSPFWMRCSHIESCDLLFLSLSLTNSHTLTLTRPATTCLPVHVHACILCVWTPVCMYMYVCVAVYNAVFYMQQISMFTG